MYVSPLFWHYRWSSSSLFVNKQRLDSPPLGILLVPLSCLEILLCGTVVQDSSLYEVCSNSVGFFFFIGDLPPHYALPPTIPIPSSSSSTVLILYLFQNFPTIPPSSSLLSPSPPPFPYWRPGDCSILSQAMKQAESPSIFITAGQVALSLRSLPFQLFPPFFHSILFSHLCPPPCQF